MDAMLNKDYDRAKVARERFTKHGLIKGNLRLYRVWARMKQRCLNPNCEDYPKYGGAGVKVCDQWLSFEGFYADVGASYEDGLELDRKDGSKGYEPDNVRWATELEQCLNRGVVTHLTINGASKPLSTWAAETGLHPETIRNRFKRGIRGERLIAWGRLPRRTLEEQREQERAALNESPELRQPKWKPKWAKSHTR
jgi:hypothetical protein